MNSRNASAADLLEESRLAALAAEQLGRSPYYDIRRVSCTARGKVVTLTGQVRSFYYKQVAQSRLQATLSAAVSLDNRLEVVEEKRTRFER